MEIDPQSFATSTSWVERAFAAGMTQNEAALTELAADPCVSVRVAVAINPVTPASVRAELEQDSEFRVRIQARHFAGRAFDPAWGTEWLNERGFSRADGVAAAGSCRCGSH